jgi:hypothetical protein
VKNNERKASELRKDGAELGEQLTGAEERRNREVDLGSDSEGRLGFRELFRLDARACLREKAKEGRRLDI